MNKEVIVVEQESNDVKGVYVNGLLSAKTKCNDIDKLFSALNIKYAYVRVLKTDFDKFPRYFDEMELKKWVAFFINPESVLEKNEFVKLVQSKMGDTFFFTESDGLFIVAVKPERVPIGVNIFPVQKCKIRSISEKSYDWEILPKTTN